MLFFLRCFALLLLSATPLLAAEQFHNALSLQGFTGVLNTPNAETTDEGKLYFLYSDQKDSQWRNRTPHQDNYMASIGLFDLLEVGGHFFEAPHVGRDLSGSFKLKVPFVPKGDYIPDFALGMQDISGGKRARYLQTKYAVASEELWRFRFSFGYGTGPDRMEGAFGGVEFKACDWFYLLADDDTKEKNVGLRFVTPQIFGYPVNLQATVKSSLDHDPSHPEIALGLQFPLGLDHNYRKPIPVPPAPPETAAAAPPVVEEHAAEKTSATAAPTAIPAAAQESVPAGEIAGEQKTAAAIQEKGAPRGPQEEKKLAVAAGGKSLQALLKRLVADGFQNVKVGAREKLLVVEYENSRYDHNELDAMGVVTGIAQWEAPPQFETLRVVEKKKGIRVLEMEMPLKELRAFFQDAGRLDPLQGTLKIGSHISDTEGVDFVQGDENSSYLTASLWIYPGLITYLGTEVSPFDYLLTVKPDLYVNLWKGAALNARADIPVSWSENFNDGKRFSGDRHDARLERLMLFQGIKPADQLLAVLGAGMVVADSYGTLNELIWTPGDGSHHLKFSQLYATDKNGLARKEEYLASYRYLFAPLDLYLQATGGKFYTQDRGGIVEVKRFFGDTSVTVFYKNAVANDGSNHQAGGIQFDFPLTLRRDMKPYVLQVRGTDDFSYAQETAIAKKGSWNYIGTPVGQRLEPPFEGDRLFYNRDRLNEVYIREHLLRFRDAYLRYVVPPSQ